MRAGTRQHHVPTNPPHQGTPGQSAGLRDSNFCTKASPGGCRSVRAPTSPGPFPGARSQPGVPASPQPWELLQTPGGSAIRLLFKAHYLSSATGFLIIP